MTISTLLIEGSFPELAEELAQYLDSLSEGAGVFASIEPELNQIREEESQESPEAASIQKLRVDVLKKVVTKATLLNAAPERGKTQPCFTRNHSTNLGSKNFLLRTTFSSTYPYSRQ